MALTFRDLTTLEDFEKVVALEQIIWGPGYIDVVPVPILAVTIRRGGILIGAFDAGRLVAFVYSVSGLKHRKPMHWSHMLGVVEEHRNSGLGGQLKMMQRDRVLAMGLELIEWTFDPMQALNAHFNFRKLGVVTVEEYEENVYGASQSPLHRGNPTDRFVAEWWIARPSTIIGPFPASQSAAVNSLAASGEWLTCAGVDLSASAPALRVQIPTGFTEMIARAPDVALDWRFATRRLFSHYLSKGYRVVDFELDRGAASGTYILVAHDDGVNREAN